jgi:hypothetical protein
MVFFSLPRSLNISSLSSHTTQKTFFYTTILFLCAKLNTRLFQNLENCKKKSVFQKS